MSLGIRIHYKCITTCKHPSPPKVFSYLLYYNSLFFHGKIQHKICPVLANFKVYNTVLLVIRTTLCNRDPELTYLAELKLCSL